MRILIDVRLYGLENAGLGRYLVNLIGELAKLDSQNEYRLLLRRKYFNRLKLPKNFKKVLADFRHYSLIEQIKLPGVIAKQAPDIVHFPHFNVPILYSGKFVVTIHDLTMHRWRRDASILPLYLYVLKRGFYKLIFRKAVRQAARIIVPSKSVAREVIDYYRPDKGKIVITYEGVDLRIAGEVSDSKTLSVLKKYSLKPKRYFIYAGNCYPHKNLGRAIEAIGEISRKSDQGVQLVIASSRDVFLKRLEKIIDKLGARKYVKLLGFVPDEDLGHLYKNSLAFVYPSFSEGFGLAGLEAIAAGTLVLASDIPVFREVYKKSVLYFNPYDFSAIESKMEEVLEMPPDVRQLQIGKAQKFIRRYSWTKLAKQTLKVYKEAIKD